MYTLEQINNKLKEIRNPNDIIITEYEGSKKPFVFKHVTCGTSFTRKSYTPSSFKTWECPTCRRSKIYKEKEQEYKNELKDFDFELLDNFNGFSYKYSYLHKTCGETSYLRAKRGKYLKCTKCINGIRKQDIHQQKIDDIYGKNNYKIINYINSENLITEHLCGYQKKTNMKKLKNKIKCPKCEGGRMFHTKETFKEAFKEAMGDEYLLLNDFTNTSVPVLIKHIKCGKEYEALPRHLLKGTKCRQCTLNRLWGKRDNDFFLERFNQAPDSSEYKLVSDYKGRMNLITLLHLECGREFTATANNILNSGTRCKHCNISKGEKKIKFYLEKLNIDYQEQLSFDDCINANTGKILKFDFGVYHNEQLQILIEYDGRQHFEANDHFGGEEKLKLQQYLDGIKNEYCKYNNIPLLRIPYTKFNIIETILQTELEKYC
ncbi:hypothetical protein [Mammaliicoccus sp. E-M24]|uniref:hypothetical protein n=1 Tax=Mammaliicoccus sp. E-M24 TaxID=2898684 RepID=UPI001EFC02C0|nr:hypothetical protein [Mammaliicoccus sp. E-M24]